MNAIKNFFQEDIPAAYTAGKLRIALIQLNSQLAQFEKQKAPIINNLGSKAWEGRVKDPNYDKTYGKLEELDVSIGQIQQEIDNTQNLLLQENDHLNKITSEFNSRLEEMQDQRQPAVQEFGDLQSKQKGIEKELNEINIIIEQGMINGRNMEIQASQLQLTVQPDKDAKIASLKSTIGALRSQMIEAKARAVKAKNELEFNQAAQKPIRDKIEGYNQLIIMEQKNFDSTIAPIQKKITDLQQSLTNLKDKKIGLNQKMLLLMPDLGREVSKYRPSANLLSAIYDKLDAKECEIKEINDQINLTNARLVSIGSKSIQKVVIVGGVVIFLLILCLVASVLILPTIVRFFH
jgi:chromosome segregation ATPase